MHETVIQPMNPTAWIERKWRGCERNERFRANGQEKERAVCSVCALPMHSSLPLTWRPLASAFFYLLRYIMLPSFCLKAGNETSGLSSVAAIIFQSSHILQHYPCSDFRVLYLSRYICEAQGVHFYLCD